MIIIIVTIIIKLLSSSSSVLSSSSSSLSSSSVLSSLSSKRSVPVIVVLFYAVEQIMKPIQGFPGTIGEGVEEFSRRSFKHVLVSRDWVDEKRQLRKYLYRNHRRSAIFFEADSQLADIHQLMHLICKNEKKKKFTMNNLNSF